MSATETKATSNGTNGTSQAAGRFDARTLGMSTERGGAALVIAGEVQDRMSFKGEDGQQINMLVVGWFGGNKNVRLSATSPLNAIGIGESVVLLQPMIAGSKGLRASGEPVRLA